MALRDNNGAQVGEAEIEEILDDERIVPKKFGCTIAFIVKQLNQDRRVLEERLGFGRTGRQRVSQFKLDI